MVGDHTDKLAHSHAGTNAEPITDNIIISVIYMCKHSHHTKTLLYCTYLVLLQCMYAMEQCC